MPCEVLQTCNKENDVLKAAGISDAVYESFDENDYYYVEEEYIPPFAGHPLNSNISHAEQPGNSDVSQDIDEDLAGQILRMPDDDELLQDI